MHVRQVSVEIHSCDEALPDVDINRFQDRAVSNMLAPGLENKKGERDVFEQ